MNSSCPKKTVEKPDRKRRGIGLLRLCLLLFVGMFFSACQADVENADHIDPAGVYTLVTVNEAVLPTTIAHGDVSIEVRSGSFTINADGTCSSKMVFGPPSGGDFTRDVNATYTREGSEMTMQWEGAGKTVGTVEGDSFSMNNEGAMFVYEK